MLPTNLWLWCFQHAVAAAHLPASSVPPKSGLPHYYHSSDVGEYHHSHHPSTSSGGNTGGGSGGSGGSGGTGGNNSGGSGGERYLTSPPLSTPPSAHTPPPAHQHSIQVSILCCGSPTYLLETSQLLNFIVTIYLLLVYIFCNCIKQGINNRLQSYF